jgi:hypothetical protein
MPSSVKNREKMVKIVFVSNMLWEPHFIYSVLGYERKISLHVL